VQGRRAGGIGVRFGGRGIRAICAAVIARYFFPHHMHVLPIILLTLNTQQRNQRFGMGDIPAVTVFFYVAPGPSSHVLLV
jgi:hypothetical protein